MRTWRENRTEILAVDIGQCLEPINNNNNNLATDLSLELQCFLTSAEEAGYQVQPEAIVDLLDRVTQDFEELLNAIIQERGPRCLLEDQEAALTGRA